MELLQLSVKEKILKAISALPDYATYEDAFEQLVLLKKIEQGLKEVKEGKSVSQNEAEAHIRARWQK